MKIVIVNASDIRGGAARAAYRLHRALLAEGVDSLMLVQSKFSDDFTVLGPETKLKKAIALIRPTLDQIPLIFYKKHSRTLFSPSWLPFSNVVKKINEIRPDIVHLHWVCGGMLRIEDIKKIKYPIVWTLHDMWPFTGGCHYSFGCEKYVNFCESCPSLNSNFTFDLSRFVWKRKKRTYKDCKITVVGPSVWIHEEAKRSSLFTLCIHRQIPNLIDTSIFKPLDKKFCRDLLGLAGSMNIIAFGALNAVNDNRKGFKELYQALKKLTSNKVELLIFGASRPENPPDFSIPTHYVGHLHDDISLVILYNAADVVVVPSLQENLPNVILESMACGTPVVAFDIGGNRDIIDHKINGYLAKPYESDDLAEGILWVLKNRDLFNLSEKAREKIVSKFDAKVVVKQYIELYREIINESKRMSS